MSKRKKEKRKNPKKEKYAKYHKEKSLSFTSHSVERDDDDLKNQKDDEFKLERFLRSNRNPPAQEVSERKMKSKR